LSPRAKKKGVIHQEVELIRQPHGGALQRGNPSNAGGGTLTKNIREAFRQDLEIARERLLEIMADPEADTRDLISIFDKLAKYSVGEKRDGVIVDSELLNDFFAVIERYIVDETQLKVIRDEWLSLLARKLKS
tara:strand:+ start:116 stop:514 length:399 start_codon:yes stop_codon:yes gene_type:complete